MVSTRRQSAAKEEKAAAAKPSTTTAKPPSKATKPPSKAAKPPSKAAKPPSRAAKPPSTAKETEVPAKRDIDEVEKSRAPSTEPPTKKAAAAVEPPPKAPFGYQKGTLERGHIYFFYRPKVGLEEATSIDDVQRFHMLLVPRPPAFAEETTASTEPSDVKKAEDEEAPMKVLEPGADAVPAPETTNVKTKPFRLIAIGKKSLPDPTQGGKGAGKKAMHWALVVTVGEDLQKLEEGLGVREYETKTRGHREQGPARLAGRGAYALVNSGGTTPSSWETHLGYHLSHPSEEEWGPVQEMLGIFPASSFVVQVKNPLAAADPELARSGFPTTSKKAQLPEHLFEEVFGYREGERPARGREEYGLKFAPVLRRELLDYEYVELLLIAARAGDEGLETSLGEGRGEALHEVEEREKQESLEQVMEELSFDAKKIPPEPLKGEWI